MLRPVIVRTILVTLLMYATSTTALNDEGGPSSELDIAFFPETRSNNLREMARLYELMQAAMQGRQNTEAEEEVEGELLPIPERFMPAMENGEFVKDKRGSYMSLCHFKICNMGRKRTWNPWTRVQ